VLKDSEHAYAYFAKAKPFWSSHADRARHFATDAAAIHDEIWGTPARTQTWTAFRLIP
jgi:hypothetical protein